MHKPPLSRNEVLLEEILNKMGNNSQPSSDPDEQVQEIIDDMYGGDANDNGIPDSEESDTGSDEMADDSEIQDILDGMYGGE